MVTEQPVGLGPDETAHQKEVRHRIQQERHAAAGTRAWVLMEEAEAQETQRPSQNKSRTSSRRHPRS